MMSSRMTSGRLLEGLFETLFTVGGRGDLIALPLEHQPHQPQSIYIIINDQDLFGHIVSQDVPCMDERRLWAMNYSGGLSRRRTGRDNGSMHELKDSQPFPTLFPWPIAENWHEQTKSSIKPSFRQVPQKKKRKPAEVLADYGWQICRPAMQLRRYNDFLICGCYNDRCIRENLPSLGDDRLRRERLVPECEPSGAELVKSAQKFKCQPHFLRCYAPRCISDDITVWRLRASRPPAPPFTR